MINYIILIFKKKCRPECEKVFEVSQNKYTIIHFSLQQSIWSNFLPLSVECRGEVWRGFVLYWPNCSCWIKPAKELSKELCRAEVEEHASPHTPRGRDVITPECMPLFNTNAHTMTAPSWKVYILLFKKNDQFIGFKSCRMQCKSSMWTEPAKIHFF